VAFAVPKHPKALAPVTVYTVVTVGPAEMVGLINEPGVHEYTLAPEAVKFTEPPAQMEKLFGDTDTDGTGFTINCTV
jgi:hypothetical protein